jgi:hypothetical protein
MPDRRTFLVTCAGVVAVPAVAHFALPSAAHALPASLPAALPASSLRIHGWEPAVDSADAWVQINASWRATWR